MAQGIAERTEECGLAAFRLAHLRIEVHPTATNEASKIMLRGARRAQEIVRVIESSESLRENATTDAPFVEHILCHLSTSWRVRIADLRELKV